jgi:hypothetical protein
VFAINVFLAMADERQQAGTLLVGMQLQQVHDYSD